MPNAPVALTNQDTSDHRVARTNEAGDFIFNSVSPGRYTVAVTANGFKRFEQTNVNLTANERLVVGKIKLEVGNVAESITVSASGTVVEIENSDRSALLTSDQMSTLLSKGRNFVALLNMLPGAVGDERYFEKDDFAASLTPSFSGVPNTFNSITVDGLASHDVANPHFIVAVSRSPAPKTCMARCTITSAMRL